MIHIFMGIFGIGSSLIMLPSIIRIYRRKSSNDFSLCSSGLGIFTQSIWLIYGVHIKNTALIVSGSGWELMLICQLLLIIKFHSGKYAI